MSAALLNSVCTRRRPATSFQKLIHAPNGRQPPAIQLLRDPSTEKIAPGSFIINSQPLISDAPADKAVTAAPVATAKNIVIKVLVDAVRINLINIMPKKYVSHRMSPTSVRANSLPAKFSKFIYWHYRMCRFVPAGTCKGVMLPATVVLPEAVIHNRFNTPFTSNLDCIGILFFLVLHSHIFAVAPFKSVNYRREK